jgi:hypothetical protein
MQQILHLLVVDRDHREGLATACGLRWLLPIVCCTERMRPGPLAANWLAERGISGDVIGQWLGHLTSRNDAMDWLVVVNARPTRGLATPPGLRWLPLQHLKSAASIIEYQTWALRKAMAGDVPSTTGPFGSMQSFDGVRDWVETIAGALSAPPVFYKIMPYEVVLGVSTASGRFYFKGLTGDRIAEAAITSVLSRELPDTFARTLALEQRADGSAWWLTEHCRGTTVAADLTCERMMLVAAALARIQQHLADRTDLHVPGADLATAAAWARTLLGEHVSSETFDRCDAAIARAYQTVSTSDLPRSWIPLDLDPGNVLIEDAVVRFIDLDDSRVGAVPLAASTFLRRARRMRTGADWPLWTEAVHRAYEEAWAPPLELRKRWPDLDAASMMIDAHLGWQRLLQKIERHQVHGARELAAARTAQRLARALDNGRNVDSVQGSG